MNRYVYTCVYRYVYTYIFLFVLMLTVGYRMFYGGRGVYMAHGQQHCLGLSVLFWYLHGMTVNYLFS